MKNILVQLSMVLFLSTNLHAQNNLPPIFEIKEDTVDYLILNENYWQTAEDVGGKWTIDQVTQSPIIDQFKTNLQNGNVVDYKIHFYWLRYRLKNPMNKDAKICLTNITNADQSDFYLKNGTNSWLHYTTGILYPVSKTDGLKKIGAIPIVLKSGEEITIYNRLKNYYFINKPRQLSVSIGFTDKVIEETYIGKESNFSLQNFRDLFTGIMLFGCLFSLFFYIIVREQVYIYYALFIFYFLFDWSYLVDVFFPSHPIILYFTYTIIKAFGIFLFVQFSRYFLKTFTLFPKWDKALVFIAIFDPLVHFANFFIEPYLKGIWNGAFRSLEDLSFVIGLFMILITYLKFKNSPDKLTRVLFISAIPAIVFWAFGFSLTLSYKFISERFSVSQPNFVNWLNSNFDMLNMLSVIWLVVSFSWVLLLQFLKLKKDNAQQALDKERLAKEKEIERNQLIEQQKTELKKKVEERTLELQQSLLDLKATQSQLIQSEKMASLGELTAGIAHEIQNPLNFVNNFSEINGELIKELKNEVANGNSEEVANLANDIESNSEKINHHGKRADAIVKGMLQHSRISTGVKESTDMNKLADEYLRLAYKGVRSKDNLFNTTLKTDFDETIGNINIIPQDIGRVLLNLYNNAFYAVNERSKQQKEGYEPTVSISTKKMNGKVEIKIADNGNGIPQKIVDKIFQPFFTTKPTGQGTGLGLSLSYDIIKAHAGELTVETKEGEGSTFIIQLPVV